ncbi:MAG TPA: DsbA family oxidoreductase, partial [Acidimicrobiales bacterium]
MQVEIWSDVVCPWCYLGKRHFERALAAFAHRDAVEVTYRSFELDPSAERGGTTPTIERLATKYGMTVAEATEAQRQMEQRAAEVGLEFHMDGLRSGNTRDAHRLLHLAQARHRQAELVERLHRAYFTEQGSIFDHGSLTELAVGVGLDRDEVSRGWPATNTATRWTPTRPPPGRWGPPVCPSSSSTGAMGSPAHNRQRASW